MLFRASKILWQY